MRRFLPAVGIVCVFGVALAWAADKKISYIDLQPKANVKLTDNFHTDRLEGNNLAELPKGEQTFADVKFNVAEGCIQLGSSFLREEGKDFPEKVEGIPVDRAFSKIHFLHAIGHSFPLEEDSEFQATDRVIGHYTMNYEDKTQEKIPIVYGEDVRDWWYDPVAALGVTRSKIAWKGDNEAAKRAGYKIRLYLTSWENPKPDTKVVSIDYAANTRWRSAPFCVAMTVEE